MSPSKIFVWFETKYSCAWFGKFSQALVCFRMQKSTSDHSVFYRRSDNDIVLLVVYVDDIVITGNDALDICLSKLSFRVSFIQKIWAN